MLRIHPSPSERKIRVSVVMPVFNRENFISAAIESILEQTYQDFELIIIDDGSSDKTCEIAARYCSLDNRVHLIQNKQNLGIACTRNIGVKEARGEYIAFMDSDDIALSQRLEKQIKFMDLHPDIGFCGAWIRPFGNVKNSIVTYPPDDATLRCRMLFRMSFANPTIVFRRDLLREKFALEFNPLYKMGSDYDYWVHALQVTKSANLQEVLVQYRVHENQIVIVKKDEELQVKKEIHRILFNFINLKCSEEELNVHEKIWDRNSAKNEDDVGKICDWLAKLLHFNQSNHIWDDEKFREEIFRILIYLCFRRKCLLKYAGVIFKSKVARQIPMRNKVNALIYLILDGFRSKILGAVIK